LRDACRLAVGVLAATALLAGAAPARAAGPPPVKKWPADLYGLTNLWEVHLSISAADWKKMQPTRGGFGGPRQPLPEGRVARGGFGFDFDYVRADLVIGNTTLKDVAVRFKGNSTYMMMERSLKRPLKVDLDKNVAGQTFLGSAKLVLNNNVMDATCAREALAYAVYRAAGVPAPRTAFAFVRLSVPGQYDRELVGLYTLIESVERPFLEDRFGSAKGLLLKPEGTGPLSYLGPDWKRYQERYRPKTKASEKAKKKLIALTHLVHHADAERFKREIGRYIDVDEFLRYIAATVVLSSVDSFIGFAHNYYLYLSPKTDRFSIIPWDLDHSFGGLVMLASSKDLMDLSIRQPQLGRNPLVEKLLADETHFASYKAHLRKLLKDGFTPTAIRRDLAAIKAVTDPVRALEKKAVSARGDAWGGWLMGVLMGRPPDLPTFAEKRAASVQAQLDGKSKGTPMRSRWPMGGGPAAALVRPILKEADVNRDRHLTRKEVGDGVKALFATLDKGKKGELDEKVLTAGLEKLLPTLPAGPGRAADKGRAAAQLARAIVERAGKDGKLSEKALLAAAEELFGRHDRDKDGKLSESELVEALQELLPVPRPFDGPMAKPKGVKK